MASKKKPSRRTNAKASHPKTEQDVREAKIELARISFLDFIEYVIKDQFGNSVVAAPQQDVWDMHLQYCWSVGKAAAIIAPMSYAKTQSIAVALPLWVLGRNENFRIIIISSSEKNAAERLQQIQRYIKHSNEYREVFPWVEADETRSWTQETLNVKRSGAGFGSLDSSVSAYGYTSKSGIGSRAELIIFDDVVCDGNAFSATERTTLYNLVTGTWLTRSSNTPVIDRWGYQISEDTLFAMIGTRYHVEDLYATLPMAQQHAWCTLIHAVNKTKTALEATVYGAVQGKPHPAAVKYGDWMPQ